MSPEDFPDEVLLSLVARGDEEALRLLYRRYAGSVLALARRTGLDRSTQEDCVQEVFHRVWKGAASFDPRRTAARSWLLAVAHHQAVDMVRRQAARPRPLEPDPEAGEDAFDLPGAGPPDAAILDRVRVRRALAALSPEECRVVEALYYDGHTHLEAAERLGIPAGTLKTRARRAIEKLREALGEP